MAQKTVSLLADGVRDGAAARAAHDFLYALRQGKVSADLNIVSFDLVSRTVVLSRNSGVPIYVADADGVRAVDQPSQPIGLYARTKPAITEIPIVPGTHIVVVTDGVPEGGLRFGQPLDLLATLTGLLSHDGMNAQTWPWTAGRGHRRRHGRPADDMSVLVQSWCQTNPPAVCAARRNLSHLAAPRLREAAMPAAVGHCPPAGAP